MKKTILATAITGLFATTAQAANLYDMDGVTVDIFGDAEVRYINDIADPVLDEDKIIDVNEANFGFDLGYDLGNGLTVGGVVKLGVASGTATLSDAYIGITASEWGTLTAGKTVTMLDGAGIGGDKAFGLDSFYEQEVGGEQVIKFTLDKDAFYGGIAYLMSTEANTNTNEDAFDAQIGARFADFDVAAFYGHAEVTTVAGDTTPNVPTTGVDNVVINVKYQLDNLGLAASYGMVDLDDGADTDSIAVTATYAMDNTTFAAGVANIDTDGSDDVTQYYVNAQYAFTGNVGVYAEIGGNDADDTELGYAAGMEVSF